MVCNYSALKHVMVALVALALGMSAFAHRAMPVDDEVFASASAAPAGIDLSAYRLPDGTLPSFCITPESGEHGSGTSCEFCTLAAGTALPDLQPLPSPAQAESCKQHLPLSAQISTPFMERAHSVRAPPSFS